MITSEPYLAAEDGATKLSGKWLFRQPKITDGDDIFSLIAACPPLDINSSYCNFLQATHFSSTCILVEQNGQVAGFISAYTKPTEEDVLFVWQVAVAPDFRGHGLALKMLKTLLKRDSLQHISAIETTITKANHASWALFKRFDAQQGGFGKTSIFLEQDAHFNGKHDTEYLYRIPTK
ncbi:diaminobutyrate acetyltransferase [Vibrio panuliri]|uniref:L-2,4-diaminobutyric acid acetyltransferase n=1 Tax=Vibrio panuliri TaxID=1381081 RepID=A0ABX3FIR9_9VIBR|nr:diaminobutyrate acetyltransferase [Vibrio panuliri]KAB1457576.1 diaminobutyrate acetyltransferase [Vibrio panuliri]OLQ91225.1 diaminobutyrate acetyltransferase [Vibrio panuliri]